ncbi:MAG: transposase family protein [Acidobacteriales bacterium]|nr:transposase family protein [Terriglobales bacterium]
MPPLSGRTFGLHRLKRKRQTPEAAPISALLRANQAWSMDFVMDRFVTERTLTVIDSYTRERFATETDRCLWRRRVTRASEWGIKQRSGKPSASKIGRRTPPGTF